MILRPLTLEAALHVALRVRESDAEEIFATRYDESRESLAISATTRGPMAWAAGRDGAPIACLGAIELWPGVWEAWMFATDDFHYIGKPLTRFIRRGMIPALKGLGAHRVQAHSIEGHTVAHKWLESLGAKFERPVPRMGRNGEDFRVYRWFVEDVA
jgi:hypothetical protein